MKIRFCIAAAAVAALVAATPAVAQVAYDGPEYRTSGFVVGAYLSGTAATYEEEDGYDSGGGLSIRLGYGFANGLSLFVLGTGSSMDSGDYTMGHFDLGVRYLVRSTARLRPYVEAALSGNALSADVFDETLDVRGMGGTLGAGMEYSVGRTLAVDVGLMHTLGRYTEARFAGSGWMDLEEEAFRGRSTRVNLGVVWRP